MMYKPVVCCANQLCINELYSTGIYELCIMILIWDLLAVKEDIVSILHIIFILEQTS